ncbi:response regulator [Bradyrhizobium sp. ma5]|uniref:response regulator n=1 Tax=Bradyrhizobium sp. ma5 TaxID=3344828 RepID=UPI001CC65298
MRVLIVDDHRVVIWGCRSLFAADASIQISETSDANTGNLAFCRKHPEVTVIDTGLPDRSGLELAQRIFKKDSAARLVILGTNYASLSWPAPSRRAC